MKKHLSEIPVLILAGGLGTRLRSVLSDRPKALAPIGDKPFLQIQMEMLRDQGARKFVLCVGYRSEQVLDQFGDGSRLGIEIDYSEERESLLGTGGAIRNALKFIPERAMVLNGDTYLDFDHNELLNTHLNAIQSGAQATCTLARLEDPSRFGTVILDAQNKYLEGFREKTPKIKGPAWLNAGAYLLEKAFLEGIEPGKVVSLERDTFPNAIRNGNKIACTLSSKPFFDIGTPEDFLGFCELYKRWKNDRHRAA